MSGVAVLTGLLFAWQQLDNTSENLQVSQQGQITDRFSRAVEQLGSTDPTIRIGGIYALDRIARDSERDHRPAMEVLAAFIRGPDDAGVETGATPVASTLGEIEARAAFGVIARRDPARDGPGGCINLLRARLAGISLVGAALPNLCLREADLTNANLARADLDDVFLQEANLSGANFDEAELVAADLRGAVCLGCNFFGADLTGASFSGANLRGALFDGGSVLTETDFNGAVLDGAFLFGVDLSAATALSQEQADAALTDSQTTLPESLVNRPDL